VIPDDARDLDRDVQAYHRERRALRRHTRVRRITAPLTRHGMIVPLIAACLAVTLLTGTLLTVLAGRQVSLLPGRAALGTPVSTVPVSTGARAPSSSAPRAASSPPPSPAVGARHELPNAVVTVDGRQARLRTLVPAVLAWIPAGCGCAAVLRQMVAQTATQDVTIYFVGTGKAVVQLPALSRQAAGLGYGLVKDSTAALATAYRPRGLTAIFAHADGTVGPYDVVRGLADSSHRSSGVQQFDARLRVFAHSSRITEDR
jgi:hypothetical protein